MKTKFVKSFVFFLIVFVLFISISFYSLSKVTNFNEQSLYRDINNKIDKANYCKISSDCVEINDPNLIFSCEEFRFINKKEAKSINEEIQKFISSISFLDYSKYCNTIRNSAFAAFSLCEGGRCIEGQPLTGDYRKACNDDSQCEGFCVIENREEVVRAYNKYFTNKKDQITLNDFKEIARMEIKQVCSKTKGNYSCYPKFEKGEFKYEWSKSDCVE